MQRYNYFSLFLLQNIDCGYSLKPPRLKRFSAENFQFLKLKKSLYIAWASFRNLMQSDLFLKPTCLKFSVSIRFLIFHLFHLYYLIDSLLFHDSALT